MQGGLPGDLTAIDTSQLMRSQARVVGTVGAGSGDAVSHIENMVELRSRGWWDPGEMLTHRVAFDDVKKAYDMYENREDGVVKLAMTM